MIHTLSWVCHDLREPRNMKNIRYEYFAKKYSFVGLRLWVCDYMVNTF